MARPVKFKLNGQSIRLTPKRKDFVVSGFRLNSRATSTIKTNLANRMGGKISESVDGHYNSVIDVVKRVTGKGVPVGKAAQITHRIVRKGTGGRESVVVKLNWAPLNQKYLLRKARERAPGRGKFWKYTGGLATAAAGIPYAKSEAAKFKYIGQSKARKGSHEFRFTVKLGDLPEPMQGLMRRSFLEGSPQTSFSFGSGEFRGTKLGLLYQLEVGGVGKAGWTRPFIVQMSAKMGVAARERLGNLKF